MLDLFNGLPLHPLVVHAVVVLLPLAILGTIAIVVVPRWRARYGPLTVAAAAVSAILVPVATSSGEELERRVGDPGRHAALGDQLIWFALPLLVLSLAVVVLDRRTATPSESVRTRDEGGRSVPLTVVSVLAIVAALACGVQVYRVGDSGARAAWGDAAHGKK